VDLVAVIDVKENPPRPIRIPNVSKVGDAAKKAFRVSAKKPRDAERCSQAPIAIGRRRRTMCEYAEKNWRENSEAQKHSLAVKKMPKRMGVAPKRSVTAVKLPS